MRARIWLTVTAAALVVATSSRTVVAGPIPAFDHIFVILMSNQSYSSVIGSSNAPYINGLAAQYGVATNYVAPSAIPAANNLALVGAATFGVPQLGQCNPTNCGTPSVTPISAPNIAVDRIATSGRTWKAYLESMGGACNLASSGSYDVVHNPLVYFSDVQSSTTTCDTRAVDYGSLAGDLSSVATTANFVFIVPNACDDMSGTAGTCTVSNPVSQGDQWLMAALPTILGSPAYSSQRSLILVLWDGWPSNGFGTPGAVPALVIAKNVKAGFQSANAYSPYSVLSTIEQSWGLASLTTNDASASPMSDFFVSAAAPAGGSWTSALLAALLGLCGVTAGLQRKTRR
jgi:hypothetical protein